LVIQVIVFLLDDILEVVALLIYSSVTKIQKRKPLPKLVYALLQEKELRRLLKQKGLSTHGDRKALISRHQR
jgi:E3 ubiquitin-protein ligase RAD18